ncbi:MAG: M48 family metallopeptidase [Candidatus Rokubacteria bacterium]|nr:M48 family metallopeptidase [Candidatus Rokubacteria bacterium]
MRALGWRPGLAFGVLVAVIAVGCESVPITGRSQIMLVSPGDETKMGVQSYRDIVSKSAVSKDPAVNALVVRVGQRIAAATGRTDLQWEYTVIEDKQANAFALPGGKIAVYTGILPITRDEAGLAAVIGHEVGHVIARHGGERVSQQMVTEMGISAVMAGLGSGNPVITQGVGAALGVGASYGVLMPFGRQQESEADHIGLILMAKAGYDPRAARDLWIRFGQAAQGSQRPPEWLSTHPSEDTRVKQIEEWLPEALQHYKPK